MSDNTNKCPRHGTFTGNTGCPFCAAEENPPGKEKVEGVQVLSKGGKQRGVTEVSKRAGTSDPRPADPTLIVHPGAGRTRSVHVK